MITKDEFEKALKIVKEYQWQILSEYQRTKRYAKYTMSIESSVMDLDISVRLINILTHYGILTIGDLLNLDRKTAMSFKNCGQRTWTMIEELKDELIIK